MKCLDNFFQKLKEIFCKKPPPGEDQDIYPLY